MTRRPASCREEGQEARAGGQVPILLGIEPWDEETDVAQREACMRSVQLDGLTLGCSRLAPVGYGICKLQIQCIMEDKAGTHLLEEEITKFAEHVLSAVITAFYEI